MSEPLSFSNCQCAPTGTSGSLRVAGMLSFYGVTVTSRKLNSQAPLVLVTPHLVTIFQASTLYTVYHVGSPTVLFADPNGGRDSVIRHYLGRLAPSSPGLLDVSILAASIAGERKNLSLGSIWLLLLAVLLLSRPDFVPGSQIWGPEASSKAEQMKSFFFLSSLVVW